MAHRLLIFLFTVFLFTLSSAWAKDEKHKDPNRPCVTSECHVDTVKHKYLHGPLAVGQCTVCHAPLKGPDHKFNIFEASELAMCETCHKKLPVNKYQHEPVAKGECLGCHDPHGSEEQSQIKKSPVAEVCKDCHKDIITKKYAHGAAQHGDCIECHPPHGSKAERLLDAAGIEHCLECHEELRVIRKAKKEDVHGAIGHECNKCHFTHDSDYKGLLIEPKPDLCFSCHEEVEATAKDKKFLHKEMYEERVCSDCHVPHYSVAGSLLNTAEDQVCLPCHEDIEKTIDMGTFKHGPIVDGECHGCHRAHRNDFDRLFVKPYTSNFYEAFSTEKYALCLECHDSKIVVEENTTEGTKFRNGTRNLHFVHVNRAHKGRTCQACHDTHAGENKHLIRSSIPFGKWNIPIRFTSTNSGGSCESGCHKPASYDREKPVPLETAKSN